MEINTIIKRTQHTSAAQYKYINKHGAINIDQLVSYQHGGATSSMIKSPQRFPASKKTDVK